MPRKDISSELERLRVGDRIYDRKMKEFGTVVAQHANPLGTCEGDRVWYDVEMDDHKVIFAYYPNQREVRIIDECLHDMFCLNLKHAF